MNTSKTYLLWNVDTLKKGGGGGGGGASQSNGFTGLETLHQILFTIIFVSLLAITNELQSFN